MRGRLIKAAAGVVIAGSSLVLIAAGASARTPVEQACLGKSLSTLATNQPGPGAFGQGVSGFARNGELPGLGAGIQALQAGQVPDDLVPNSCNG